MKNKNCAIIIASACIGVCIVISSIIFAFSISSISENQRTVQVKGLSEREVAANAVIWPIVYKDAGNDLTSLYGSIDSKNLIIKNFLIENGISESEISIAAPNVTDRSAEMYGPEKAAFRFYASAILTVSTDKVDLVRSLITKISSIGKNNISFSSDEYQNQIEYKYTKLNDIKNEMVEEATKNARATAQKFADDSESSLGKIKTASQGQFSINNRDNYTPYIKIVRVVSSIEYFIKD